MAASVRVTLYAAARQAFGDSTELVSVPAGGVTVQEMVDRLTQRSPRLGRLLPSCRFVINGEYASGRQAKVMAGDEFAVHPPYSGG